MWPWSRARPREVQKPPRIYDYERDEMRPVSEQDIEILLAHAAHRAEIRMALARAIALALNARGG